MRNCLIHPKLVARPDVAPKCCASGAVDQPHDRIAINRSRHRLTKLEISKPSLLARDSVQLFCAEIVEIENQEVVFQTGTKIHELRACTSALSIQQSEILSAEPADHIGFTRFKAHDLRVLSSGKNKDQLVQVRQAMVFVISFPVIRV